VSCPIANVSSATTLGNLAIAPWASSEWEALVSFPHLAADAIQNCVDGNETAGTPDTSRTM
jgi:phage terminase large subunit-like protein